MVFPEAFLTQFNAPVVDKVEPSKKDTMTDKSSSLPCVPPPFLAGLPDRHGFNCARGSIKRNGILVGVPGISVLSNGAGGEGSAYLRIRRMRHNNGQKKAQKRLTNQIYRPNQPFSRAVKIAFEPTVNALLAGPLASPSDRLDALRA
jgi:hypothetical protein